MATSALASTFPWPRPVAPGVPARYAELRHGPAASRVHLPTGEQVWVVASYDGVCSVLRDPRFSSEHSHPGFPRIFPLSQQRDPDGTPPRLTYSGMDGAEHRFHRSMVADLFSARRMAAMETNIRAVARAAIMAMLDGPCPADLVGAVAEPVASGTICEVLGIAPDERASFHRLSTLVLGGRAGGPDEAAAAAAELKARLSTLLAEKRRRGTSDLLDWRRCGVFRRSKRAGSRTCCASGVPKRWRPAGSVEISTLPAFRHDPAKSVLRLREDAAIAVRWSKEPAVCGYRRFVFSPAGGGAALAVPICATPVVVPQIGVIVGGYDGFVRFFDASLDRLYWERRLEGGIYAPLVADPQRRALFAATIGGGVTCFDLRGTRCWSCEIGAPVYAAPVLVAGGRVLVVAAFDSLCVWLDAATGRELFRHALPTPWYARMPGTPAHRDPYASPVATTDGGFILCCAQDVLSIAADGSQRWAWHGAACIRASPLWAAASEEVIVCTVDGQCHFLDGATGRLRGSIAFDAKIVASPAISGAVIAIGTADDRVHGVCAQRREKLWSHSYGAPKDHTSFSVLPDGSFIATRANGNIVARRAGDGGFLWETNQQIGVPDLSPALDTTPVAAADGRMYCANYAGDFYAFLFDQHEAADR